MIATYDNKEQLAMAYKKFITEELARFNCTDVELAYKKIVGNINVDGLWYRIQKRLAKK